jgi:hypothetical protein
MSNNLPLFGTAAPLISGGFSAHLPGRIKKLCIESISIFGEDTAAGF